MRSPARSTIATRPARIPGAGFLSTRVVSSLALGAALTLALACGNGESPSAPAPAPPPPPEESAPTAAVDRCAPPEGGLRGDPAAGAAVYQQYCNLCHGPEAPPVEPKPADHKNCGYMTPLSDEHLYRTICGGGTAVGRSAAMPAWRDIVSPEDVRHLIGYLRQLCPA